MPRPKKDDKERTLMGARIDSKLYVEIKHQALDEGRGIYELIEDALTAYMQAKKELSFKASPIKRKDKN